MHVRGRLVKEVIMSLLSSFGLVVFEIMLSPLVRVHLQVRLAPLLAVLDSGRADRIMRSYIVYHSSVAKVRRPWSVVR